MNTPKQVGSIAQETVRAMAKESPTVAFLLLVLVVFSGLQYWEKRQSDKNMLNLLLKQQQLDTERKRQVEEFLQSIDDVTRLQKEDRELFVSIMRDIENRDREQHELAIDLIQQQTNIISQQLDAAIEATRR